MGRGPVGKGAQGAEEGLNRGDVVWVDLSDASPPEMGKRWPCVVVSNSVQNQPLDTLVVVPLSSRPPELPPLRIRVDTPALKKGSFAVVPGLRQVKKARLLGGAGKLTRADMQRLERAVLAYLAD